MSAPIKREDIRKGDRVRMVVTSEFTAVCDLTESNPDDGDTETYELIERPVVLPTEPGFYMTAYSPPDVFQLLEDGQWFEGQKVLDVKRVRFDGGNSLTLLRPVAEVAAEVLAQVHALFGKGAFVHSDIDALAAKWATK